MHALDTMCALASKAEVIHLNQGDVLFRTGETGTCMYGLLEGIGAAHLDRFSRP